MLRDELRRAEPAHLRAIAALRDAWRGQVTRRLSERGEAADSFFFKPTPLRIGSRKVADAMLRGQFVFDGQSARAERGDPWRITPPSDRWAAALHGFEWLHHFRAGDGPAARDFVRRAVDGWLHHHSRSGGFAWRPAIAGDRATAWAMNAAMLIENAEPVYRSDFLRAMGAHARYLRKASEAEAAPLDRLRAATGALYGSLCLEPERPHLSDTVTLALKASAAATARDGGPASRNPSELLERLARLAQIRRDLETAGQGALAERFNGAVEAAAAALRGLRHGDGGLAVFHGGREENAERIDRALSESRTLSRKAPRDGGYLRLSGGRTLAIIDSGSPSGGAAARRAHSAPLAMEVSSGRRRIIVNCGSATHLEASWEIGCRGSAAHSTVTVADASPGRFEKGGAGSPPKLRRLVDGAMPVSSALEEDDSGCWALAAHDGYASRYGLIHYRRMFLSSDGRDLRGEDTLTLAKGGDKILKSARAKLKTPDGPGFTARFHLHPDVTLERDEEGVLLTLQNGESWRMLQSGGRMTIEDSIYLPTAQSPRETSQIVVQAALEEDSAQIKWAFKRLDDATRDNAPGPDRVGEGHEEARADAAPPFPEEKDDPA